jgi:hypothetical protein
VLNVFSVGLTMLSHVFTKGMNEIVATIYVVLCSAHESDDDNYNDHQQHDDVRNWSAHAEADTYWLFYLLLQEIKDVFLSDRDSTELGIQGRIATMSELLKKHDPAVAEHLEEIGIESGFFAIRWWTTLLSREFEAKDVVRLWDSLFASTHKDNFLRYVCVTMVMAIREDLLMGDFSKCLRLLQNYPFKDVHILLASTRALWMYESTITVACHKGGISLHQALQAITPPPSIIMAFGLRCGSLNLSQEDNRREAIDVALDQAAERVRDATKVMASSANAWLGRAKVGYSNFLKGRSKSQDEKGQGLSPSNTSDDVVHECKSEPTPLLSMNSEDNNDVYLEAILNA